MQVIFILELPWSTVIPCMQITRQGNNKSRVLMPYAVQRTQDHWLFCRFIIRYTFYPKYSQGIFFFKYSSLLQYLDVKKHIPDARYESLLYILFPAPGNWHFWTPNLLQAVFLVWVAYSDLVTSGVSVREGKKKKKCKLLACFFLWPRKTPCSYIL